MYDYVFVGGGLSAGLSVLGLLAEQPACTIAIVERGEDLGGNHTWCFHARDVPAGARHFIEPLIVQRWPGYEVRFPQRMRRVDSPYACVSSERLNAVLRERLAHTQRCQLLLGSEARECRARAVVLADGRVIEGKMVIDARGPQLPPSSSATGYQKFVGLELEVEPDHELREPILMDACVRQADGFRFMYVLPLAPGRVLVEDTFFADGPLLDATRCEHAILAYAKAQGLRVRGVVRREQGVLPMPWKRLEAPVGTGVIGAGFRGSLYHPVTGYSFPLAARFAERIATSYDARRALEALAKQHDEQLTFLHLLSRALFTCFAPHQRYRVLEHFYRLPKELIERFYAAELGLLDRARILSGAPPRGMSVRHALTPRQVSP